MTNSILTDLQTYLWNGAPLTAVATMIEMLKIYQNDVEGAIEDYYDLLPAADSEGMWGTEARRQKFREIARFVMQQGYTLGSVYTSADTNHKAEAVWVISKGDRAGELHWTADTGAFWIEGIDRPRDPVHLLMLPTALADWIEPDAD